MNWDVLLSKSKRVELLEDFIEDFLYNLHTLGLISAQSYEDITYDRESRFAERMLNETGSPHGRL